MKRLRDEDSDAPNAREIAEEARAELQRVKNHISSGKSPSVYLRTMSKMNFDIMTHIEVFCGVLAYEFLAPDDMTLPQVCEGRSFGITVL